MSYTYVILGISRVAYEEIYALLDQAGYSQAFHGIDDYTVIDMHGIAVRAKKEKVVSEKLQARLDALTYPDGKVVSP